MSKNNMHKGAIAEMRAAAWLLEQGYEVFRNVSDVGQIDLVAVKDGEIRLFDVKYSYRGGCPAAGVEHLSMNKDGSFRIMGERKSRATKFRPETERERIIKRLAASGYDTRGLT